MAKDIDHAVLDMVAEARSVRTLYPAGPMSTALPMRTTYYVIQSQRSKDSRTCRGKDGSHRRSRDVVTRHEVMADRWHCRTRMERNPDGHRHP